MGTHDAFADVSLYRIPRSVETPEDSDPGPALKGFQDQEGRHRRHRWSQGCHGSGSGGASEKDDTDVLGGANQGGRHRGSDL